MSTVKAKKFTKAGLIFFFLKGSLWLYVLSVACNLLVMGFNVLIPRVIGFTVDSVIGVEEVKPSYQLIVSLFGGLDYIKSHMWLIAVAILAIAAAMAVFRYIHSYTNVCANEKMMQRMRNTLFSHIQRLPLSWHVKHQTGDIIQRCSSDAQTILNFVSNQMMPLIRIVALIALSLTFMFMMNWKLALIASVFVPVIFLYSLIFYAKVSKRFKKCDEEEGVLSTRAQENFTGVRVVRAFGRERYEKDKFEAQNSYYTNLWVKLERFLAMYWTSSDFVVSLQLLLIVAVGTVFCIQGTLTPGEFIEFISYNAMLIGPIRMLGRIVSNMSKAGVSLGRISEIMNGEAEEYGENEGTLNGDISFEHVGFCYEEGKPVLTDVTFNVPQGTTLGIIGGTGSGKSTLTCLLDGLYAPTEGNITIGGRNIADIPLKTLRGNMGLVLQEGYLYSRTVGENIAITEENPSEAAIRHAAQVACVDGNIEGFAKGYDTIVGERGVTLSGGQKQRVSIARTLMRGAPILIFDDSLSAVDSDTDAAIRANLSKEFKDATVIIISHRITTVMHADNIIVLDSGKIAEQGTGKELLEKGGIYKRIYDMQMSLPEELRAEAGL